MMVFARVLLKTGLSISTSQDIHSGQAIARRCGSSVGMKTLKSLNQWQFHQWLGKNTEAN